MSLQTMVAPTVCCVLLPLPPPSDQTMGMPLPVPLLTIDMLDDFPDDGTRYELLEGMLLVTPAPSFAHQVVATRLASMLAEELEPRATAVVVAVGAIQRGKHTQLQPDVLVCPPGVRPTLQWRDIRGWWLAAEVVSPSSRLYDREVKRGAYLELGVEEYWVVDPADCSVERWSRERPVSVRVAGELVWRPAALDQSIVIDLPRLFRGICDED
jgi:Uma2 family endonuclease